MGGKVGRGAVIITTTITIIITNSIAGLGHTCCSQPPTLVLGALAGQRYAVVDL